MKRNPSRTKTVAIAVSEEAAAQNDASEIVFDDLVDSLSFLNEESQANITGRMP